MRGRRVPRSGRNRAALAIHGQVRTVTCEPIRLPGVTGIVCHARRRRRRCRCGVVATLECDHPVERTPRKPRVGDSRLHRERRVTFYLMAIEGERLQVATESGKSLQWISHADWFNKAAATCDQPICARCATAVGAHLHHCPAHAGAR